MARLGRQGFLAVAVVFHLIYVYSIFDIYFVSPVVGGMRAYRVESEKAPAKRLVLYVGDGLRADKAFQFFPDPSPAINDSSALVPRPLAPFLRSRVLDHGTFGVSHTRVPTESRPGHVALIAGLYEDVAAVTTGWKMNPVNFDSVFNRSRHTWSWGSPDILPMFSHGAVPGRVEDATYGAEFEDFSKDGVELDIWVFDRVKQLFADAKRNATLNAQLRQDKIVFFLHLLGIDTTGHAFRPYSKDYLNNIKVVDQGVKEITKVIDDFYNDGETAYIFTADHGMSDWGSHGDGHPDNTRTPLITWGAGIAKPVKVANGRAPGHGDGFSADWHLDNIKRHDVAQADVAALMAYLVGLEFPVNSVGELPLSFLDATVEEKAKALLVNAKEILEMYKVKEMQKSAVVFNYKPYPGFANVANSVEARIGRVEALIDSQRFKDAIATTSDLIKIGVGALRYLQTYDWLFLRTLVTIGYLGWVAFALTTALDSYVLDVTVASARSSAVTAAFGAILIGLYSFLFMQSSPATYYLYALFPVAFWEEIVNQQALVRRGIQKLLKESSISNAMLLASTLASLAFMEIMVQSYYHREIYTVCYLIAAAWPITYGWAFVNQNMTTCILWVLSCASMSVFTILPANKVEDLTLITAAGCIVFAVGVYYMLRRDALTSSVANATSSSNNNPLLNKITTAQIALVAVAVLVTRNSVSAIQAKQGLPLPAQFLGWLTLVASLLLPSFLRINPRSDWLSRFLLIFFALGPTFVILTISYEGFFFMAITSTLLCWVQLESRLQRHTSSIKPTSLTGQRRSLRLSDGRIALFFLFFLQSAFFSTGNIASVSSFSLEAVARLIPVFDPFSQGALLLLKLLAPFSLVSASLGLLTNRLRLKDGSLFVVVMAISDYLTLRFFWEVRDEGSWLEIGESISMFVIASTLCVFVAGLEGFSGPLLKGVWFPEDDRKDGDAGDDGIELDREEIARRVRRLASKKSNGSLRTKSRSSTPSRKSR